MQASCDTRYPVVLVHGVGFRDLKWPLYWGRIPAALEARGAAVYFGGTDAWGSVETNAAALCVRIDEICAQTGCEKVNIIAHSKGGLDARMAASALGHGACIASITTVATPHAGSKTIDRLFALPRHAWSIAAFAVNNWVRVIGDARPDFLRACQGFTTSAMCEFNAANPDVPGVMYQSYACVMRRPTSDVSLWLANAVLARIEGENDGLVAVTSALWGEGACVVRAPGQRGISHFDAIDVRRAPFARCVAPHRPDGAADEGGKGNAGLFAEDGLVSHAEPRTIYVRDICDLYVNIVCDLRARGL